MKRDRIIRLDGAFNFRDLGGFGTASGGVVRRGAAFRSDDLNLLSPRDLKMIGQLGIKTAVDFRDRGETRSAPDQLPDTVESRIHIPIEAGRVMGLHLGGAITAAKSAGAMVSVYRTLVNEFQEAYRMFFDVVADPGNAPFLFHCSAGKDRTGLAAALFLSALGVGREEIFEDYLLSERCLKGKYRENIDYDAAYAPLYGVRREYLDAAFAVVDGNYGGVEAYLRERLGVDTRLLRNMYVEM